MGVFLVIESYGETIVQRELLNFEHGLLVPTKALEVVADMLRHAVERQFDTEGREASGGWPELADSTKAKRGDDGHPILQVSEDLFNSLTRKFDPNHIERLSAESLTFGSTVPYGIFHQSSKPRTKIPFRPPVALTQATKAAMVRAVQAALRGNDPRRSVVAGRYAPSLAEAIL